MLRQIARKPILIGLHSMKLSAAGLRHLCSVFVKILVFHVPLEVRHLIQLFVRVHRRVVILLIYIKYSGLQTD